MVVFFRSILDRASEIVEWPGKTGPQLTCKFFFPKSVWNITARSPELDSEEPCLRRIDCLAFNLFGWNVTAVTILKGSRSVRCEKCIGVNCMTVKRGREVLLSNSHLLMTKCSPIKIRFLLLVNHWRVQTSEKQRWAKQMGILTQMRDARAAVLENNLLRKYDGKTRTGVKPSEGAAFERIEHQYVQDVIQTIIWWLMVLEVHWGEEGHLELVLWFLNNRIQSIAVIKISRPDDRDSPEVKEN